MRGFPFPVVANSGIVPHEERQNDQETELHRASTDAGRRQFRLHSPIFSIKTHKNADFALYLLKCLHVLEVLQMNQNWASCSRSFFFLTLLLPLSASPAPRASDPCKQLHRDLDRQIDDAKAQQKDDRQQCEDSYGGGSDECSTLKDQ